MPGQLAISIGQHSDKGRKDTNQDFHGALIPEEPLLSLKGIAIVLADGISTSEVGGVASESAVKSFLTDYYCTSDSWSVKTSAQRVIAATNSWLHAQTRQSQYLYDKDRGYVCTLSAMVIKSTTAHNTAPEYFLGEGGSQRSDIFSLGVIAYQMLTGRLPYGAEVARTRTKARQKKLRYQSALNDNRDIPAWVDGALKKAVHPDPYHRYDELSEFVFDLRHSNKKFLESAARPLIERDPLLFWKCLSAILFVGLLIVSALLIVQIGRH